MPSDDLRGMFESRYVGAWDLGGRDVDVTIDRVVAGTIDGENGRKDKAPLIYFVGKRKPMVCNKTNLKTIAAIVGSYKARDWAGKRITLYATTTRGASGGMVDCVRVRPNAPRTAGDSPVDLDEPVNVEMRTRQTEEMNNA